MSFSDTLENEIVDHVFGVGAYTAPSTLWIGLSTADPGDDAATLAEPTGNNYSRVARINDGTTWATATAGRTENSVELTFPEASGSWGTITHVALWTHVTSDGAAVLFATGALGTSKAVGAGDTPRFQIGSLSLTLT